MDTKTDSNGETKSIHKVLSEQLQINVISIVLGALVIGVFIAVVDTLRAWCAAILDKETEDNESSQRYRIAIRRTFSTFVILLIAIFLAILLITWLRDTGITN